MREGFNKESGVKTEAVCADKVGLAHGVGEWARKSVNIQDGCPHDCRYCYAKAMAIRFGRTTPKGWDKGKVRAKAVKKQWHKKSTPATSGNDIMFPTSHDIHPANLLECTTVLKRMLEAGNRVLIVSKPWLVCVKGLCRDLQAYRSQITFRFTIGSADDKTLGYWELGAPRFSERLASLKHASQKGFATSVSCEPMLDLKIDKVVEKVRPFTTDSIWLGRANRLISTIGLNCPGDTLARNTARTLLAEQDDAYLLSLYERFKNDPLVRFKDSIKKVAGVARPAQKGLDI